MNLLEYYLKEIHSITECKEEWTKEEWAKDKEWITVDATFNCWGGVYRHKRDYTKEEWEEIETKGYYMG